MKVIRQRGGIVMWREHPLMLWRRFEISARQLRALNRSKNDPPPMPDRYIGSAEDWRSLWERGPQYAKVAGF